MEYKLAQNCRCCGSTELIPYIHLGMLPLSNNLAVSKEDPIHGECYPLEVKLCMGCGLSQLSIIIPPEKLFSHYVFRSSISQGYINHCNKMAVDLKEKYSLNENSFVIDIAGNDGALLKEFNKVIQCLTLNVDPASNLKAANDAAGVKMYNTFWGIKAAQYLTDTSLPMADIVTATNVFAHVDNVREFLLAVKMVLKPTGKLILEFPYLIDFITKREFDTIYFEHLSYFGITPLSKLVKSMGLNIESVERQHIHGGSVRVTIGYNESDESVDGFIKGEIPYLKIEPYNEFYHEVTETITEFATNIKSLSNVAAFAASAKGNTLLNCAGVDSDTIRFIVDETPEKIGKFSPGTKIPILPLSALIDTPPDYLLVLSWNFADDIMAKCRAACYTGKFIIPIPKWTVVE